MLYALGFIMLFTIGGLTGLFLGALATDVPLHDTYFVVAHFHYVMMGSTLFAFLAGHVLLVPQDLRQDVQRPRRPDCRRHRLRRVQPDLLPAVHHRRRTAAPRRWATYPDEFQIFHMLSTSAHTRWRSG